MSNIAIKVPVIESERGWGSKIDDWMVVLSEEDAKAFIKEFNSKNTASSAPDWYMQAEDETKPIELTSKQMEKLKKSKSKRVWLSILKDIK